MGMPKAEYKARINKVKRLLKKKRLDAAGPADFFGSFTSRVTAPLAKRYFPFVWTHSRLGIKSPLALPECL